MDPLAPGDVPAGCRHILPAQALLDCREVITFDVAEVVRMRGTEHVGMDLGFADSSFLSKLLYEVVYCDGCELFPFRLPALCI